MIKTVLSLTSLLIGALGLILTFIGLFIAKWGLPTLEQNEALLKTLSFPKPLFERPSSEYDQMLSPAFSLQFSPVTVQVPNLRSTLQYQGQNKRPDAKRVSAFLSFSLYDKNDTALIPPGTPLYLDVDSDTLKFSFSSKNAPTALWIQAEPKEGEALVSVRMRDETGQIVKEPESNAQFTLKEKELRPQSTDAWSLGSFRVDAALLSKQHAKWYGEDLFLKDQGGDEFSQEAGKERIDFGEGGETYSVYVGSGDFVIWDKEGWREPLPNEETTAYPLLQLKKIQDRLLTFDLWNIDGKGRMTLNLLKSSEKWNPKEIEESFKFKGARRKSEYLFEANKTRLSLESGDWWILLKKGWKRLSTPGEIDEFVERRLVGPLLIVGDLEKKGDRPYLKITLYSPTRSEEVEVLLPVFQGEPKKIKEVKKDDEEEEDSDDEDDEMIGYESGPWHRREYDPYD